jgi:hypothetical protein
MFNMPREIAKRKSNFDPLVKIIEFEELKIADEDIAWELVVLEFREVIEGLLFGTPQVKASAFLLDEQYAFPEKIDESASVA